MTCHNKICVNTTKVRKVAVQNVTITGSKINGKSAYDLAVEEGFQGTLVEWLQSLKGESAYDLAVKQGFTGTEEEFVKSLKFEAVVRY